MKSSDVNKDWTCKDKEKDKDLNHKDRDKDKDFTYRYSYLLQVAAKPTIAIKHSSNNNEHKVKVHDIWL